MNLPILEFLFQCYFLYKRHTHFSTLSVYTVIFNPIIITWYTLYTTINCTPFYKPQYSFSTNHNPKFLLFNYTQKSHHIIGDSIINFILYLKTSFVLILESDYFNNSIISSSLFDNDLEISSKLIPFVSIT